MRKILGEYKEDLERLFNSFRKRFGLEYNETIEYVDELISDTDYAVLYFASDGSYTRELINDINSSGVGKAYGFYKDGSMPYSSVEEIREAIPNIVGDGGNIFIFVELEERSRFRVEDVAKTIFVKQGRDKGNMVIDIVKSREYLEDEVIKQVDKSCKNEFNELYNTLYKKRREVRKDLFLSNFKMSNTELLRVCDRDPGLGAFVCFKNDVMVGFVVYEVVNDIDHRSIENVFYYTVRDIYVLEEYRRCGIASRMFREVCRLAEKSRAKVVRFKTWEFDEEITAFVNSLNKKKLYTIHEIEL